MDYWKECIKEALYEAGIIATEEQIDAVVEWVEGAHENYSLATGEDVAHSNYESDESLELKKLKDEIEKREEWTRSTRPCPGCLSTGAVLDGWGRDTMCFDCDGKGRIKS